MGDYVISWGIESVTLVFVKWKCFKKERFDTVCQHKRPNIPLEIYQKKCWCNRNLCQDWTLSFVFSRLSLDFGFVGHLQIHWKTTKGVQLQNECSMLWDCLHVICSRCGAGISVHNSDIVQHLLHAVFWKTGEWKKKLIIGQPALLVCPILSLPLTTRILRFLSARWWRSNFIDNRRLNYQSGELLGGSCGCQIGFQMTLTTQFPLDPVSKRALSQLDQGEGNMPSMKGSSITAIGSWKLNPRQVATAWGQRPTR